MKIRRSHVIVTSIILLGLIFITLGIAFLSEPVKYYAHSLRHPQEADSIAGYPIAIGEGENKEFWTAEFEPNLSMLTSMERFRLPTARRFSRPTEATASANGLVLYTGKPEGYPGQAVLLGHRLPNGDIVQSFYAGLASIQVRVGEHVAIGEELGELENALYFEIRKGAGIDLKLTDAAGVTLNSATAPTAPNRLDLDQFFATYQTPDSGPVALAIMRQKLREKRSNLENLRMDSESMIKLQERTAE